MAIDYSNRQFPTANKWFTQHRRNQTTVDGSGNTVPAPDSSLATGLSMTLEPIGGTLMDEKGGSIFSGSYNSRTFKDIDIRIGDMFYDTTEQDKEGNPVEYECKDFTRMGFDSHMILRRTDLGEV